ncbi:MerR family transcriptional regulator [Intrasporangium sp. DVR]|uniref:MerR family transcriptional regulator n=1 Tax=Intrasporangium sp. DVR TaxID=3127867 RepID=UPI00313A6B9C
MQMSMLAARTQVPVATIKYYLREGLLHPGLSRGATRADYDESHVDRVHLIRTLVTVGHLSIERVRLVVAALEHPPRTRHELLGTAHAVLQPTPPPPPTDDEKELAGSIVALLGWPISADSAAARQLAAAVSAARAGGWACPDDMLVKWGGLARSIAEVDVADELATMPPADALQHAIVGTVLTDPILVAMRRLAQEAVSAERLA